MPTRLASTDLVGLEVIERARCAPAPGAQRAPVVGLARLALVGEADDALGEAGAIVGLHAARIQIGVAPAGIDELLGGRRIARRGRRQRCRASRGAAGSRAACREHRARHAARGRPPALLRRDRPVHQPRTGGGAPGMRPPPNRIITGTGPFASAGVTSTMSMFTSMAGCAELSTLPCTRRRIDLARRPPWRWQVSVTDQVTLGTCFGMRPEHLALEQLDDLRPALLAPLLRRGDGLAAFSSFSTSGRFGKGLASASS